MEKIVIRKAKREDSSILLNLIKKLAHYQRMDHEVITTTKQLEDMIFNQHASDVLLIDYQQKVVGYALYFKGFSSFLGAYTMHLEDIYIEENYRHLGLGKQLFLAVVQEGIKQDCRRLDWSCLNWNDNVHRFYQSLGGKKSITWQNYSMSDEMMRNIGGIENDPNE